jgi:hypothetical protein
VQFIDFCHSFPINILQLPGGSMLTIETPPFKKISPTLLGVPCLQ